MSRVNKLIDDKKLMKLLKEVAVQKDFSENSIEITDDEVNSGGYLANIAKAEITNKSNPEQKLNVVVKLAPINDNLREEMSASTIFNREIYMYQEVFPFFELFVKERNMHSSMFTPKLFKTELKEKSEAIVMENLSLDGYRLYDKKFVDMDEAHLNLVFATYGQFHALSFAARDQNPECFKNIIDNMKDVFTDCVKKSNFVDILLRYNQEALELIAPVLSHEDLAIYKRFIQNIPNIYYEMITQLDDYFVIIHGDSWMTNIMFKYEEADNINKPCDIRLLDFQTSRLGSPVIDLSYFFYSSASEKEMDKLESYLKVYYESLSSYLRKLGSCPEKLFPFGVLQEHWMKYAQYGLINAPFLIKIILSTVDEISNFTDTFNIKQSISETLEFNISKADIYKMKIQNVVLHFLKNKFIL